MGRKESNQTNKPKQSVPQMGHYQTRKKNIRDATECIKSIEYSLLAVFQVIFSNPNALEIIMNYIYK